MTGIYKIQSISHPDRLYIGSSVNMEQRWRQHLSDFNFNRHHSPHFQRHYGKYGRNDLMFSVVALCERDQLMPVNGVIWVEQCFIWAYKPYFNGAPVAGSCMGVKHSDEVRQRNRERNIGRKQSAETIEKRVAKLRGRRMSEEAKAKISVGNTGKVRSVETCEKLRLLMIGRKDSDETREKKIKSLIGRPVSTETKEKISKSNKGQKRSLKTRTNISKSMKGRVITDETRLKMSESAKKARAIIREKKLNCNGI
jgi:group I intron endonuclease